MLAYANGAIGNVKGVGPGSRFKSHGLFGTGQFWWRPSSPRFGIAVQQSLNYSVAQLDVVLSRAHLEVGEKL